MNTSAKKYRIIGVGGKVRSGKDSLVDLFVEAGYFAVSGGDIVRVFARERHSDKSDPISVKNMTETSNWLRSEFGPDVILKKAMELYEEASQEKAYKGLVSHSIRAPIEVDFILEHGGDIIWVEASDKVRYQRDVTARREGEADISEEEFLRQEALQWKPQPGIDSKVQMDLSYVKEKATITFENNGSYEEFKENAKKLVEDVSSK